MTDEPEDFLWSIGISPRERLAHIEKSLVNIDEKLDIRFDAVELRLTKVENIQAGQASTAVLVEKATNLADEAAKTAAILAAEKTSTAADLAKETAGKAVILAENAKISDQALLAAIARLDLFERRFARAAGAGGVLIVASGLVGHFAR